MKKLSLYGLAGVVALLIIGAASNDTSFFRKISANDKIFGNGLVSTNGLSLVGTNVSIATTNWHLSLPSLITNGIPVFGVSGVTNGAISFRDYAEGTNVVFTTNGTFISINSHGPPGAPVGTMVESGISSTGIVPATGDISGTNYIASPLIVSGVTNILLRGNLFVNSITATNGGGGGGALAGTVISSGSSLTSDNSIVRVDGTGGTNVQQSVVILDDAGTITGINALTTSNNVNAGGLTLNGTVEGSTTYYDSTGTNFVNLIAPAIVVTNMNLVLPKVPNTGLLYGQLTADTNEATWFTNSIPIGFLAPTNAAIDQVLSYDGTERLWRTLKPGTNILIQISGTNMTINSSATTQPGGVAPNIQYNTGSALGGFGAWSNTLAVMNVPNMSVNTNITVFGDTNASWQMFDGIGTHYSTWSAAPVIVSDGIYNMPTAPALGALVGSSFISGATNVQLELVGAPLSVYAAGTAAFLTNTATALTFGTTSPTLVLTHSGTYMITARANLQYNGSTFAASRTVLLKLRRTNNTAADLTNGSTTLATAVVTTQTSTFDVPNLPTVIYSTANSNDSISIFGSVSSPPTAGSLDVTEASIVAIRLY